MLLNGYYVIMEKDCFYSLISRAIYGIPINALTPEQRSTVYSEVDKFCREYQNKKDEVAANIHMVMQEFNKENKNGRIFQKDSIDLVPFNPSKMPVVKDFTQEDDFDGYIRLLFED